MNTQSLDMPVAILAGGLATRLRPITEKIPKILVPVAGKPFLVHQLELLRKQGITRVVLCLGHLGEMVVGQFGDGRDYGVQIDYSFDGPALLGTGGALKQALPLLGECFFVLYGDSYLTAPLKPIADFFEHTDKPALMTVFRNEGLHDTSNIVFSEGQIVVYDKRRLRPEMHYIDYGLSLFRQSAFDKVPDGVKIDLADIMKELVSMGELAGYEVPERFYEIGSPDGLKELEKRLMPC